MRRATRHLRTNIVGYVALFFALSVGAYAAGLAPDSVRSRHIKDGQVRAADVGADALGGAQIAESTLGEVRNATIAGHGGYGRTARGTAPCSPQSADYITCVSVGLTPSAPGRVFLMATFQFNSGEFLDDDARAECRLGASDSGGLPGTNTLINYDEGGVNERVTLQTITDVYQPGNYSFGIDCKRVSGVPEIYAARITAIVISPF